MNLKTRLERQIALSGPLSVAQYMAACLYDPQGGYYASAPALGMEGDFITAPLVSQMFGELIGLWAAEVWVGLGRPARIILAEAGPGDGTLMTDALRAVGAAAPDFAAAAEVWLVEVSEPLRAAQGQRLAGATPRWADGLANLPADAPLILIANEMLDCLPARQYVRTAEGWAERMVGLDHAGGLIFGLQPAPAVTVEAAPGSVLETSAAQEAFGAELGGRLAAQTGAALLIDYGRDAPGFGDTLQALRGHAKIDPLAAPGESDLTIWANFPAVLAAAGAAGATTAPILTQAEFLRRLGVEQRAETLMRARPDRAETMARQLHRLTAPDQMGELFKAACLYAPPGLAVPAFAEARA